MWAGGTGAVPTAIMNVRGRIAVRSPLLGRHLDLGAGRGSAAAPRDRVHAVARELVLQHLDLVVERDVQARRQVLAGMSCLTR